MNIFRLMTVVSVCLAIPLSGFARKYIKMKDKHNRVERSIAPIPSVEAWLEDNGKDISLLFYKNLSEVNITITDASGKIMYKETVNATVMSSQYISLDNLLTRGYVLSITDSKNDWIGFF